jgi:hypothetical protein
MVNWTVIDMMVKVQEAGYTDVVYLVNWLASDTDGTNEARYSEKTEVPTPAGPTFTPYDQLTEAQVIGWVKDVLGPEKVAAIEADLNAQILFMQQPPVTSPPLPWS